MNICIISDHIIMLRQNFIIILSILIKQSLNMKGGGFSPQSPPPPPPPWIRPCSILKFACIALTVPTNQKEFFVCIDVLSLTGYLVLFYFVLLT